jgi:hypothetical protein
MANDVYANGNEIACKAASGKSICAFPDVCMTPPENPATPPGVPVPYPNTGSASDTTDGSRSVQISSKEVTLKNKSYFKTSMGDEAGCAAKKGVITSSNTGKVYFIAWSMNVKFEGENVDRHLDMTTHNHASPMANEGAPMGYIDTMQPEVEKSCSDYIDDESKKCAGAPVVRSAKGEPAGVDCSQHPGCKEAKLCVLKPKKQDKSFCCQPGTTGHHLVEAHGFCERGQRGTALPQFSGYKVNDAVCVCVEGSRHEDDHGKFHAFQGVRENAAIRLTETGNPSGIVVNRPSNYAWTYRDARDAGLDAHEQIFGAKACKRDCLKQQLDDDHGPFLTNGEDTPLRTEKNNIDNRHNQQSTGLQMAREAFRSKFPQLFG